MKSKNLKNTPATVKKVVAAFLLALAMSSNSYAAQIVGINFQETVMDEGVELKFQGAGLKTVAFFKAFVAGYYANDTQQTKSLGQFSKRIEVNYFVKIPAKKLNKFTVDSMKDNISNQEFNALSNEVSLMKKYFVDLKPGDKYTLTYINGLGTKFEHNDQLRGVIKGNKFAKALFSVWVGDKPFDAKLKGKITGDIEEPALVKQRIVLGQAR